jgi:hypothetical protein
MSPRTATSAEPIARRCSRSRALAALERSSRASFASHLRAHVLPRSVLLSEASSTAQAPAPFPLSSAATKLPAARLTQATCSGEPSE